MRNSRRRTVIPQWSSQRSANMKTVWRTAGRRLMPSDTSASRRPAEKRTQAARSTTGSEEEHAKKQPKFENAPPGLTELIQELREEKAQLRAENRELKAKLDELIARLASTGVEGDHIEQD
eukprot:6469793-Amphidinium_carterae.1